MNSFSLQSLIFWLLLLAGLAAPLLFPDYTNEIAVLWLMILFALTWDILGGQLSDTGAAVLPKLLDPDACARISALYNRAEGFRSHVHMARHGFGKGE